MKIKSEYLLLLIILLLCFCSSSNSVNDGSSTETGNVKATIKGVVVDIDSSYLDNIPVSIKYSDYVKSVEDSLEENVFEDTTSDLGSYYYEAPGSGIYLISIMSEGRAAMAYCTLTTDSAVVSIPLLVIQETGSCKGQVTFTGGDDDPSYNEIFVQWFGTDKLTRINNINGSFITTGLSAGIYSLQIYPANYPDMAVSVDSVVIVSGEETIIDPVTLTFGDG